VKLSLQLTGKQQKIILEECLYLIDDPCSELLGPEIGGSPRESLCAGWRSCNPLDR